MLKQLSGPQIIIWLKKYNLLWLLGLFLITLLLHLRHPLNSDEGLVLAGAWNLLNHQKLYLDLLGINLTQIREADRNNTAHIEINPYCTYCKPEILFSFRRENIEAGCQLGFIGLR